MKWSNGGQGIRANSSLAAEIEKLKKSRSLPYLSRAKLPLNWLRGPFQLGRRGEDRCDGIFTLSAEHGTRNTLHGTRNMAGIVWDSNTWISELEVAVS